MGGKWVCNNENPLLAPKSASAPSRGCLSPCRVSLPARPDGARACSAPAGWRRGQALPGTAHPAQKLPGEALLQLASRPLVALQTPGRACVPAAAEMRMGRRGWFRFKRRVKAGKFSNVNLHTWSPGRQQWFTAGQVQALWAYRGTKGDLCGECAWASIVMVTYNLII